MHCLLPYSNNHKGDVSIKVPIFEKFKMSIRLIDYFEHKTAYNYTLLLQVQIFVHLEI